MLIGCIADDFTGASDVANTLARGGMKTGLAVGAEGPFPPACEAVVVALKTRSVDSGEAVSQSLAVLNRLRSAGCAQVVFKYCSTFDSTPEGNIGPVAMALAAALGTAGVVVCPVFPAAGRTVYQGHLFVGDRLLSESGMERHPLTPMTDPDIRRWLARQTGDAVGHVRHEHVQAGDAAIAAELDEAAGQGVALVVVDAISEADLLAIGRACAGRPLVTGGSGVAMGLPENFRRAGQLTGEPPAFAPQSGPALVLSGSCSSATLGQVASYRADHPVLELDLDGLVAGRDVKAEAQQFVRANRDQAPLVFSSGDPSRVQVLQARHGRERLSGLVEGLFAEIARDAVGDGVRRLVVAGGETSGAVVSGLGVVSLELGDEIAPGVPALSASSKGGEQLALALKSGNFGAPDFFARAVQQLGGG